jgi:hypothetical protein
MNEERLTYSFEVALILMKEGRKVTRLGFNNPTIHVEIQIPDAESEMTKPYIFMEKGDDRFPLDMSCESILADDWVLVND